MADAPAKSSGDENFPVASVLIAARLRPTVMAYYAVARATDDVADDPNLEPAEKLRRLDRFEAALLGGLDAPDVAAAVRARSALAAAGVRIDRATRLLRAFRRDAEGLRCGEWGDLLAYCADSADPVGRFLLDLHGERACLYPASDALCTALQVLNHLQDCRDDFLQLGRVYLPEAWLEAEGVAAEDLASAAAIPGVRRVLDRCLAEVDTLLAVARPLPHRLRSTRLALETAVILRLATALSARLKRRDPIAERVRLSRPAMLMHGLVAAVACLWQRTTRREAGLREACP